MKQNRTMSETKLSDDELAFLRPLKMKAKYFSAIAEILENARFQINGGYYSYAGFEIDVDLILGMMEEMLADAGDLPPDPIKKRTQEVIENLSEAVGCHFGLAI